MEPVSDDDARKPVTAGTWIGFGAMCVGMFMAILDVQIVATSLPTIQSALGIAPDQMSWVQTAYLIAEVIAIPLTGFLLRVLSMRWLFVSVRRRLHPRLDRLRGERAVRRSGRLAGAAGLLRRNADPGGVRGGLPAVPATAPGLGDDDRGRHGGLRADRRADRRRLDHRHLLLALAVSDQRPARARRDRCWPRGSCRGAAPRLREARALDLLSLALMAHRPRRAGDRPEAGAGRGWTSGLVARPSRAQRRERGRRSCGARCGRRPRSSISRTFADRRFAIGCILSFVLGIGLFGSVYLMPVFLAFVRGHDALEIGTIMLVTGVAQLLMAPVAVALEQRANARLLTAAGFGLFAVGLGMSAFQTPETDFAGMFWPQVVRGLAIMFCLLPPTRLALGHLDAARVPDASGVFNLMRNLGGAIGLALIDTVIYTRAPQHGEAHRRAAAGRRRRDRASSSASRSTCSRTARPGRSTPPRSSS